MNNEAYPFYRLFVPKQAVGADLVYWDLFNATGSASDLRVVSIVPIVDGEKIVMRLLSEYVRTLTLNDLGFSEEHRQVLEKAAPGVMGAWTTGLQVQAAEENHLLK